MVGNCTGPEQLLIRLVERCIRAPSRERGSQFVRSFGGGESVERVACNGRNKEEKGSTFAKDRVESHESSRPPTDQVETGPSKRAWGKRLKESLVSGLFDLEAVKWGRTLPVSKGCPGL
ncbi:hypothetical protein BJ508DRAFT_82214 [Ascobolus immersus RN42]|uniref:Uncharacterized protein n=1 Tax=Ascobolus immersus RN42 TaxID=1160509 RepID=A0A3N4HC61_ASCIM|nr:hypothetical protein BJ508DRAFT_82214 [Ascobolus immersus RN42]